MNYLIWDFDGTLGTRPGGWSGMLAAMLTEACGIEIEAAQMHLYITGGFTWSQPERPHPELDTPDKWWDTLDEIFERAFCENGAAPDLAWKLARQVREVYPRPEDFILYEDTLPALDALTAHGWTHLILSNHVPEFESIATVLGLTDRVRAIFNSAHLGYEKPHWRSYRAVLETIRDADAVWMLGDNPVADVQGAAAAGIPAILVRRPYKDAPTTSARYYCPDLAGVPDLLRSIGT